MPQPNKKRGRRMGGKKRKLDEDAEYEAHHIENASKRRKSTADDAAAVEDPATFEEDTGLQNAYPAEEKAFFGMLDEQEQEYFKRADDMLEADAFADPEERILFIANVYREADGKELKIAQSQSCSRLMERLIRLSSPPQLKNLFQKFSGNFIHLITHRFASHCCEALFLRAAPAVTEELLAPPPNQKDGEPQAEDSHDGASMESLYLQALSEMEGNVGFLMTDRYASHALRVLLLVLAGEPIDADTAKHLLQSKKKETSVLQGAGGSNTPSLGASRSVPSSFSQALEHVLEGSIAGLDTDKLRALATHSNASPTLQLLLKLELVHYGKQKAKDEHSIIRTLLPDTPVTAVSGSAKFISGLVYDPVGSHLVETIIQHAPGKIFKSLYSEFFKDRLDKLAYNDIAAHVVCRILGRLGKDDLEDAHERLVAEVTPMLQRGKTKVVRALIEACTNREIPTKAIAVHVNATWDSPEGFEVRKLLKWGEALDVQPDDPQDSVQSSAADDAAAAESFDTSTETMRVNFNVLAQAMLLVPGPLSALVLESLVTLEPDTLINMSKDRIVSRTIQSALTSKNASLITTRKLIQRFYGHVVEMALDKAASHVVDCIWAGTHGLAFIRERIAEELAEAEQNLRESSCGRAVWKNWKMDLYKRRRNDWIRQSKNKASNDGFQSFSELDENKDDTGAPKTPIELARERHAKEKKKKEKEKSKGSSSAPGSASKSRATSSNAIPASGAASATATVAS